jgi:hypothetical protein
LGRALGAQAKTDKASGHLYLGTRHRRAGCALPRPVRAWPVKQAIERVAALGLVIFKR